MPEPNLTCLIIEDSALDRVMMGRAIEDLDHAIGLTFAGSLAEARAALDSLSPAIIFLDNSLPDGHGADFIRELALSALHCTIPILVVTDWPSPFMYAKARSPNVIGVWEKEDFKAEALEELVRQHIPERVH